MPKFDLSQLIATIIKDKCSLQWQPIEIEFADKLFSVLIIGDDIDFPKKELEIFLNNPMCIVQLYPWETFNFKSSTNYQNSMSNLQFSMPNFDESWIKEFNIYQTDGLHQFSNCLIHHCEGNHVTLQYHQSSQS